MADELEKPKTEEPIVPTAEDSANVDQAEQPAKASVEDKAVEADDSVQAEASETPDDPAENQSDSRWRRWRDWYASHKKISIPATILVLLILLAAIPATRYAVAGVVVKKDLRFQVTDATAHTPVSSAQVAIAGQSTLTDANGFATAHKISAGPHDVIITKKYYQTQKIGLTVPVFGSAPKQDVSFTATGRQVKIVTTNLITGKKLPNVTIRVADVEAKTDSTGNAVIVVPAGSDSQTATLSAAGYNQKKVTIQTNSGSAKDNNFELTPAGSVYFLSKRTGKLDVMKINLDGTSAKVVIKGTGLENSNHTVLMPSGDGKYVALLTQRAKTDKTPQLYVFATEDEKLFQADSAFAGFTLMGWTGSQLVYSADRNDLKDFQLGKQKIKSYDASNGKITLLDQTEATNPTDDIEQFYAYHVLSGDTVIYAKSWSINNEFGNVDNKRNTLNTIDASGKNFKTVASYDTSNSVQYLQHSPVDFYIWQQPPEDAGKDAFYDFRIGDSPKKISLDADKFFEIEGLNYYASPSGNKTLWSEIRDGKGSFLVGDSNGDSEKEVASLDEFQAEGWYTDDYILASKKGSELYIMSAEGGKPIKLADYQATFNYY